MFLSTIHNSREVVMVDFTVLRRCGLIAAAAILIMLAVRCSDAGAPEPSPGDAAPTGVPSPVFAPLNASNPYDAVGVRHNRAVHAALLRLPKDALSTIEAYDDALRHTLPPALTEVLAVESVPSSCIDGAAGFLRNCGSPSVWLARFPDGTVGPAAATVIRRIGGAFATATSPAELRDSFLVLERDACARDWSDDPAGQLAALGAVAVARHSTAYWGALLGGGSPFAPVAGMRKPGEIRTELIEKIAAADVAGFVASVTSTATSTSKDLGTRLFEGTLAAVAASAIEAGGLYLPELAKTLMALLTR
jgi:hypothetical protein